MRKVKRFSLEERYGYQNRKVIYDKNADDDIELNNIYPIIDLLNQLDEQIADLQKQLKEKEKYTYTGKEVGEIERKYDEKIDTLEQQLKSQPAEIVEKIKEQIFNHFNVKNIEEYERLSLLNALFTADAVAEILDTILKEYQK